MMADIMIAVLAMVVGALFLRALSLSRSLAASRQENISNMKINHVFGPDLSFQNLLNGFNAAQDGIAIMDDGGNMKFANDALWKIYGIPPMLRKDFLGQSWVRLHSHTGRQEIQEKVMPVLENNRTWFGETDVKTHGGLLIRAELSIWKTEDGGFIGIIRDVTERYKQAIEKDNLLAQLYQSQKAEAIGRVLRGLVHDFNNTLASISGFSELLLEDMEEGSTERTYVENIFQSSQQTKRILDQARMLLPQQKPGKDKRSDIVKDILALSNLGRGPRSDLARLAFDIKIAAAETLLESKKQQTLISHLLENAFDACKGRDGHISIVLDEYRSDGKPENLRIDAPSPRIEKLDAGTTRLSYGIYNPDYKYVEVTVSDTGCGIAYATMPHIFDPFFSTKNAETSTGMGLSIVQTILKQGDGYITVESREGAGTVIHMLLRAVPETVLKTSSLAQHAQKGAIVLVDDQDKVRLINKLLLEKHGFQVFDFVSPYEALDFMQRNPKDFQYVFTDVGMPEQDGISFSHDIHRAFPEIPVFLLTGYDDMGKDLPKNIKHVLKKPLDMSDLTQAFATVARH